MNSVWTRVKERLSKILGATAAVAISSFEKLWVTIKVMLALALLALTVMSAFFFYNVYRGQIRDARIAAGRCNQMATQQHSAMAQLKMELKALNDNRIDKLVVKFFGPDEPAKPQDK